MYLPRYFKEDDHETLLAFMRSNNFVTLVSSLEGKLIASHIPVLIKDEGSTVTISGHLAKANPHWQAFGTEMLIIFTGPHAYISPKLYEKLESVPTWNYLAVHAYGLPRAISSDSEPALLQSLISDLVQTHEASYQQQWDSLSEKFRQGMLQGIVGFEMTVTRLEGKYKLSQNRSETDQHSVAEALAKHSDPTVSATGKIMKERMGK
jgi:transcriptional regulator